MSFIQDAHTGGDLYGMAKDGTSIPHDAGRMNIIPSVSQLGDGKSEATTSSTAAENARDIPRGVKDSGVSGEVESGTGNLLPSTIKTKRLHGGEVNNPAAKGHNGDGKHLKQKESLYERGADSGSGVGLVPGEE